MLTKTAKPQAPFTMDVNDFENGNCSKYDLPDKSLKIPNITTKIPSHGMLVPDKLMQEEDKRFSNKVTKNIEEIVIAFLENLKNGITPSLTFFNRRSWKNVSLENKIMKGSGDLNVTLKFDHPHSRPHIALIMHILSQVHHMNIVGSSSTKRELFYQNLGILKRLGYPNSQEIVDSAVYDSGALIGAPPRLLGVLPSSRGLVAGKFSLISDLDNDSNNPTILFEVDTHRNECCPIPCEVATLKCGDAVVKSSAKYVLIVEKDAAFQKLLDDGALERLPSCILLTGRGYPDVSTRRLVHLIWKTLKIPLLALVDADPHGIEIMCIYRFGSLAMSKDAEDLAVPGVRWLGIHPTDLALLGLDTHSLPPLGREGISKAEALLKRPYVLSTPGIYHQVEELLKYQKKAEIEAMNSISPTFLLDVYIPGKIASKEEI